MAVTSAPFEFSRRRALQVGATTATGLLLGRPTGVLAQGLGGFGADPLGTPRASRLFPGEWVVHADLHNHTLFSDGDGDPAMAFASMRDAGLDVAALTDHTTLNDNLPVNICAPLELIDQHQDCQALAGMNEAAWADTLRFADAENATGTFAAIRGFEWSSPTLGHMNVWFSETWTDPANTGGLGTPEDLVAFLAAEGSDTDEFGPLTAAFEAIATAAPRSQLGMAGWYEWLKAAPSTPVVGGGADAIFGFNHPGREAGRFAEFQFDQALVDRCVSLELFNRNDDYLFERVAAGFESPLVACLDAGWKPGLLGVTDEHGTDWGYPDGKGRSGVFVTALSRDGVRAGMEARRFFATNLKGLRVDAAANGAPMGSTFGHTSGVITFQVDVDRGADWYGRPLRIQVLRSGSPLPTILHTEDVVVPRPDQDVIRFDVAVDVDDGTWVVLRVTDPALPVGDDPAAGASTPFEGDGRGIAYASPFWLDPTGAPPPGPIETAPDPEPTPMPTPTPTPTAAPGPVADELPATGGGLAVGAAAILAAAALRRRGHHGEHRDHGRLHGGHPHGKDAADA